MSAIKEPLLPVPGFSWLGENVGIKDDQPDFAVAWSRVPCQAAGVFTRNNFPGAPLVVGKEHLGDGQLQGVVVNSKNANVATGSQGLENARRICAMAGEAMGVPPELVLPSSTGVIGVPLPMERIIGAFDGLGSRLKEDRAGLEAFSRAIMTTDTRPKAISLRVGSATLTGVAKGAGMIEPNMATMLAYFFTDAELQAPVLQGMLGRVVKRSFNRISVDTDTSTSDTAVILANGIAGSVNEAEFETALLEASVFLAKEIARDGEGATKLIELSVFGAPTDEVALQFGKTIINSPLVKTAIHGADPNWGRFVMAVGKVFEHPVPLEDLSITFGNGKPPLTITATVQSDQVLQDIGAYLTGNEIKIRVGVGRGAGESIVWGCDLTEGYVKENADYTT